MYATRTGAGIFVQVDPKGAHTKYSAEDNAKIDDAIERRLPSVRVSDVTLPDGKVLSFEVRIGKHARSKKFPRAPQTGLLQVNLANGNSRVVAQVAGVDRLQAEASVVRRDGAAEGGAAATWEVQNDGEWITLAPECSSMLSLAERTGQFLVSLPDGGEANLGTGTYSLTFTDYFHLDPQGKWQPYPEETNNMISDARVQGLDTLRLPDVQIPGRVLRFEMRFGAAAVSERMPQYIAKELSDDQVNGDPAWAGCQFEQAKLHTYHVNPTNPLQGQWRVSQHVTAHSDGLHSADALQ